MRLVRLHDKSSQNWARRFAAYIEHNKLDFPGEDEFFLSSETRFYRLAYVRKYGLSERMRDMMLTRLYGILT